jgi:hypothetical protein
VGPFASVSSKALPSATRSLSSIVTNVKNGYNNGDSNKPSLISSTPSSSSSQLLPSYKREDIATKHIIATYELKYQRGKVIALGIYSDGIIKNN